MEFLEFAGNFRGVLGSILKLVCFCTIDIFLIVIICTQVLNLRLFSLETL